MQSAYELRWYRVDFKKDVLRKKTGCLFILQKKERDYVRS